MKKLSCLPVHYIQNILCVFKTSGNRAVLTLVPIAIIAASTTLAHWQLVNSEEDIISGI